MGGDAITVFLWPRTLLPSITEKTIIIIIQGKKKEKRKELLFFLLNWTIDLFDSTLNYNVNKNPPLGLKKKTHEFLRPLKGNCLLLLLGQILVFNMFARRAFDDHVQKEELGSRPEYLVAFFRQCGNRNFYLIAREISLYKRKSYRTGRVRRRKPDFDFLFLFFPSSFFTLSHLTSENSPPPQCFLELFLHFLTNWQFRVTCPDCACKCEKV